MKCSEKTTHKLRETICNTYNYQSANNSNLNKTINKSVGKGQNKHKNRQ